jgi:hypothetical protein
MRLLLQLVIRTTYSIGAEIFPGETVILTAMLSEDGTPPMGTPESTHHRRGFPHQRIQERVHSWSQRLALNRQARRSVPVQSLLPEYVIVFAQNDS